MNTERPVDGLKHSDDDTRSAGESVAQSEHADIHEQSFGNEAAAAKTSLMTQETYHREISEIKDFVSDVLQHKLASYRDNGRIHLDRGESLFERFNFNPDSNFNEMQNILFDVNCSVAYLYGYTGEKVVSLYLLSDPSQNTELRELPNNARALLIASDDVTTHDACSQTLANVLYHAYVRPDVPSTEFESPSLPPRPADVNNIINVALAENSHLWPGDEDLHRRREDLDSAKLTVLKDINEKVAILFGKEPVEVTIDYSNSSSKKIEIHPQHLCSTSCATRDLYSSMLNAYVYVETSSEN